MSIGNLMVSIKKFSSELIERTRKFFHDLLTISSRLARPARLVEPSPTKVRPNDFSPTGGGNEYGEKKFSLLSWIAVFLSSLSIGITIYFSLCLLNICATIELETEISQIKKKHPKIEILVTQDNAFAIPVMESVYLFDKNYNESSISERYKKNSNVVAANRIVSIFCRLAEFKYGTDKNGNTVNVHSAQGKIKYWEDVKKFFAIVQEAYSLNAQGDTNLKSRSVYEDIKTLEDSFSSLNLDPNQSEIYTILLELISIGDNESHKFMISSLENIRLSDSIENFINISPTNLMDREQDIYFQAFQIQDKAKEGIRKLRKFAKTTKNETGYNGLDDCRKNSASPANG
jgi:hypothetical protein